MKTFKNETLGVNDNNIGQIDKQLTHTDGEAQGEHTAVIGFAQNEEDRILRSFPDENISNSAREFWKFENLKIENSYFEKK